MNKLKLQLNEHEWQEMRDIIWHIGYHAEKLAVILRPKLPAKNGVVVWDNVDPEFAKLAKKIVLIKIICNDTYIMTNNPPLSEDKTHEFLTWVVGMHAKTMYLHYVACCRVEPGKTFDLTKEDYATFTQNIAALTQLVYVLGKRVALFE